MFFQWTPTQEPRTLFGTAVSDFLEVHSKSTREKLEALCDSTCPKTSPSTFERQLELKSTCRSQLEYVRKAACARQQLSENIDVDQCSVLMSADDFKPLPVGRLYALFFGGCREI